MADIWDDDFELKVEQRLKEIRKTNNNPKEDVKRRKAALAAVIANI